MRCPTIRTSASFRILRILYLSTLSWWYCGAGRALSEGAGQRARRRTESRGERGAVRNAREREEGGSFSRLYLSPILRRIRLRVLSSAEMSTLNRILRRIGLR